MFRLKLFGTASLIGPAGPVSGRAVQRRRIALLALLGCARDRGMTREKLVGYLWPDSDVERARHLLSDSVYRINQATGGEAIMAAAEDVRLNQDRLPCDVWEFSEAAARGDWRRAVELHDAPFLDGFYLTAADELERWVDAQRERFLRDRARALEQLAGQEESSGAHAEAVHWWRILAEQDPFSSRIALRLMRALDASGDRAAALQHARVHADLLEQELDLAPDRDLLAFAAELRRPSATLLVAMPSADEPSAPSAADESKPLAADRSEPAPVDPTDPPSERVPVPSDTSSPPLALRLRRRAPTAVAILILVFAAVAAVARMLPAMADTARHRAIAVLPFTDLSPGRQYEYFAAGMTEELIARLANVEGLAVLGRTSAFAFRSQSDDVREIAERLGVTAVLEGSVRHSGDRVRIAVRLTDARNGYLIWTETYDRRIEDVLAIQQEIALAIVTRLRGEPDDSAASRLAARGSALHDPETFNLYLKGRHEWHRRTERSLAAAIDYFQQAVARTPDYARAQAGLADAYAVSAFYDFLPPAEAFPAAAAAAQRALELDADLAVPHATLGYVALYHDWDWTRAENEFRLAIRLQPAYSTGHQWYANHLTAMGRFDEAIAEMNRAMELDPLSMIANAALGWVLYYAGEYEQAVVQCTRALELDSTFVLAYLWRGQARAELGQLDAAAHDVEQAVERSGGSAIAVAQLARILALKGDADQARELLQQLASRTDDYVPPYELAAVHAALGDTDAAVAALERAFDHRSHSIAFLAVDPQLTSLHGEPRFRRLVERVGLDRTPGGRRLD